MKKLTIGGYWLKPEEKTIPKKENQKVLKV